MSETMWTRTEVERPEKWRKIDWISEGGQEVNGGSYGGGAVWFLPGENPMYVYYTPKFWRYSKESRPTP